MSEVSASYYIPDPSRWPLVGSIALSLFLLGGAVLLNGQFAGIYLLGTGLLAIFWLFYGWFRDVVRESLKGYYSTQVDLSFRWAMGWFVFSELMFFAVFFGALFYARVYSVPWLGGEGSKFITHEVIWPQFEAVWPLLATPDGRVQIREVIPAWGLPALNTIILLSSGATITLAHWALKGGKNRSLCAWLAATILLGFVFVYLQATEYVHAYQDLDLTLDAGIYGSTFFMLTGFHGLHVSLGATMLVVILLRAMRGHFTAEHHFAFEGVAWYWHFVDVVWLGLFIFVYWF